VHRVRNILWIVIILYVDIIMFYNAVSKYLIVLTALFQAITYLHSSSDLHHRHVWHICNILICCVYL
jgi:hypothetical protein